MYSGLSRRSSTARREHQERADHPVLDEREDQDAPVLEDRPISSYFTFASGGYIIRISPMAMGMEVVPTLKRSRNGTTPGTRYPSPTPTAMAGKIQSVR